VLMGGGQSAAILPISCNMAGSRGAVATRSPLFAYYGAREKLFP
jgi:hypothetical protein